MIFIRNSVLMKKYILEYYAGDPDTMSEYDDSTNKYIRSWYYDSSIGISCGWFQTSLDGGKEFVSAEDTCHYALTQEIGRKILGKAVNCQDFEDDDIEGIGHAINNTSAFKGRTFDVPRVVTTWHKVSSEKLYEILEKLGGVEKFQNYEYVFPKEHGYGENEEVDAGHMNVIDYINSHDPYVCPGDIKRMQMDIKGSYSFPEWMVDIVREYNRPNSTLAAKTAKLGNMTIAQYNSLIHQEEKEPKNTIKENDMKENKYQKEFSNYIEIMNEALKRNDFGAYNAAKRMLDETIEDNKHENELLSEMKTNNFGILNHIFEQQLPTLFKTNKKAVRDVVKLIKEDSNLKNEFAFYNAIKTQYKGKAANIVEAKEVLEKLADISVKGIDQKTVRESNKKLRKVMLENNIIPSDFVDDESRKLYESGHIILTHKKTTANMIPLIESYHTVCQYMENHKNDVIKESKNIDDLISEFEDKMKTNLNESEMSFVQQITDFRSPIAEQRKEKLFNKLKEDCLTAITSMLKEDSNNEELKGLSSQLNEMVFDKNNIVKDIAKLLEIRDILMDD
jgi:hypothetical protein